jgi:hypothetical protein
MIDVDYLHEPLDWHDKSCEACGKDLEKHAGNELDPVVVHFSGPETQVPAYKYSVKGSILQTLSTVKLSSGIFPP